MRVPLELLDGVALEGRCLAPSCDEGSNVSSAV
jgi:hypothetical protein